MEGGRGAGVMANDLQSPRVVGWLLNRGRIEAAVGMAYKQGECRTGDVEAQAIAGVETNGDGIQGKDEFGPIFW